MSLFLSKIKFIDDFRCYKKGDEIELKNQLTVITGDNGSGKSSLISCIRQLFDTKWSMSTEESAKDKIESDVDGNQKIGYLDLSADLYKGSAEFDFDNMDTFMQCMSSSSGEGSIFQMASFLKKNRDCPLIILDEPERGLSIKKQRLMKDVLESQ